MAEDLAGAQCIKPAVMARDLRSVYRRQGYVFVEDALDERFIDELLAGLENQTYVNVAQDNALRGHTRFLSKNGPALIAACPKLEVLEREYATLVNRASGVDYCPIDNREIGISVNVTMPGGRFATHFDRQEISAVAYFNTVDGGEIEVWPRLRRWVGPLPDDTATKLTLGLSMALPPVRIKPKRGSIVFFDKTTPHRVSEVRGDQPRISVIFALDRPGVSFLHGQTYYGYEPESKAVGRLG